MPPANRQSDPRTAPSEDEDATSCRHLYVLPWVPEKSPGKWTLVYGLCALASLAWLVDAQRAMQELYERPNVKKAYIVWNFSTSVVWMTQVVLTEWYHRYHKHYFPNNRISITLNGGGSNSNNNNSFQYYAILMDMILAVYFAVDSIHMLFRWKIKRDEHVEEEMFDVVINLAAYTWMTIRMARIFWERRGYASMENNHIGNRGEYSHLNPTPVSPG